MKFEYWQTTSGEWAWHLKAANHQIIATGEGYKNRADMLRTIERIQKSVSAPVMHIKAPRRPEQQRAA